MSDGKVIIDTILDSSGAVKGLKSLGSAFNTALGVTVGAIGATSAAMVGLGASAVKVGSTFDSSMSQVAATMGFTVKDLQDSTSQASQDMQTLRDFAQEMGSTTVFSASQSAEALNYMALAGYNTQKAMKMLPSVMHLAAAGGIDLAYASDMVTDTSSALGLSMEETEILVDQMATTASKSNTSVQQLGEAMLSVGATAKLMKGGTTEIATALGILADNGTKSAEGGTALRNVLLSLANPKDKAKVWFDELGVSIYDTEGSMRSLKDIFLELSDSMKDFTDEQKTEILGDIFNKTDLGDVNYLLSVSAERWDELGGAIENSKGSAEAMSNIQLDNLTGDITLFKSALEGIQITLSEHLMPTMREFVKFGSEGVQSLNEALKNGGVDEFALTLGDLIAKSASKISLGIPKIIEASSKIIEAFIAGIAENAPEVIASLFEALGSLTDGIIDILPDLLEVGLAMLEMILKGMIENLPDFLDKLVDLFTRIADQLIWYAPILIDSVTELLTKLANELPNKLPIIMPKVVELITVIATALAENVGPILAAIFQIYGAITLAMVDALPQLIEAIPGIIESLCDSIIDSIPDIVEAGITLFSSLLDDIPSIVMSIGKDISTLIQDIVDLILEGTEDIKDTGEQLASSLFNAIEDKIEELSEDIKDLGKDIVKGLASGIEDGLNFVEKATNKVANKIKSIIHFSVPDEGPLSDADEYGPDFMKLLASGIQSNSYRVFDVMEQVAGGISTIIDPNQGIFDMSERIGSGNFGAQIININQPIATVDELSEEFRIMNKYGLMRG